MKNYELDPEEQQISDEMSRGEWVRDEELYARYKKKALKRITINFQEEDIDKAREEAEELGMPYQTLLASIVHQYFTGRLEVKKTS